MDEHSFDVVRETYSRFAKTYGSHVHREGHYTLALCAMLWPYLGDRLLVSTGLPFDKLEGKLDPQVDALRRERIPKTRDFYVDLLLTSAPYLLHPGEFLQGLHEFADCLPVTAIYEFKYLSAFPTLSRQVARADAVKLKVVGDYLRNVSGVLPHRELVIFNFPASDYPPKQNSRLRAWFVEEGFVDLVSDIHILIVDQHGEIDWICQPNAGVEARTN